MTTALGRAEESLRETITALSQVCDQANPDEWGMARVVFVRAEARALLRRLFSMQRTLASLLDRGAA